MWQKQVVGMHTRYFGSASYRMCNPRKMGQEKIEYAGKPNEYKVFEHMGV